MAGTGRHWRWIAAGGMLLALAGVARPAPPPDPIAAERARLGLAKAQSAAAKARSEQLERAAGVARDAAARARAQEAAVAARIQRAQADIDAAQVRIVIVRRLLDAQRQRLATQQGPTVRLLAALQSMARRPALVDLAQPGSVAQLVHVRAVLGATMPAIRARTADLRRELARTRQLQTGTQLAVAALGESRGRLERERVALARLEAEHRLRSRSLGRDALLQSDRAIALGEEARDIVDLMDQIGNQASIRADLESLPGPLPRPLRPGEVHSVDAPVAWAATPPYRLPVDGRLITGLGEISDAGVRSRGLTIETRPRALVVAPAAGSVAFARAFRGYGVVVIIDHGGGWTSLVANLGRASVRVGDRVAQGGPIGESPAAERPRVTVELRRRDRAIDVTRLIG